MTSGRQRPAVGRKVDARDGIRVTGEGRAKLFRFDVPQLDGFIGAGRRQCLSVRRKNDGRNGAGVSLERDGLARFASAPAEIPNEDQSGDTGAAKTA